MAADRVWYSYEGNDGGGSSSVPLKDLTYVDDLKKAIWKKEKGQFKEYNVHSAAKLKLWLLPDGKPQESRLLEEDEELSEVFRDTENTKKKKKVFVTSFGAENWNVAFVVKGTPVPQGDIEDYSNTWIKEIKEMLLPQLPELPRNEDDLKQILFPEPEQHRKLPIPEEVYASIAGRAGSAKQYLIKAYGSRVSWSVANFLLEKSGRIRTELDTTVFVTNRFRGLFELCKLFKDYAGRCSVELLLNCTEKGGSSHSRTLDRGMRPDTLGICDGCALLVGEDKLKEMRAAEADLQTKVRPLNKLFYGNLKCILGYAAAGTYFRWKYIGKGGGKELCSVGPKLNLEDDGDHILFLLSICNAYQLLAKMESSIPAVPGRRAMHSSDEVGPRTIYFDADRVKKYIKNFATHCTQQGTNITSIASAYFAAEGCKFLPQRLSGPIVEKGTYKVEFGPVGYACVLDSEQDCRWMSYCVCKALCILHKAGLVHKDVRLPNIVRLSSKKFMLIDLESVATCPFRVRVDAGFERFTHWHSKILYCKILRSGLKVEEYTFLSDLYSLGKLLAKVPALAPGATTGRAQDFINMLKAKKFRPAKPSEEALQHPWLSDLDDLMVDDLMEE